MSAVRGEEVDKEYKDTAALSLERFDGRQHASNEVAAARIPGSRQTTATPRGNSAINYEFAGAEMLGGNARSDIQDHIIAESKRWREILKIGVRPLFSGTYGGRPALFYFVGNLGPTATLYIQDEKSVNNPKKAGLGTLRPRLPSGSRRSSSSGVIRRQSWGFR